MAEAYSTSLEYAPTWVVAVVCSIILVISLSAERGLHVLGKLLVRNKQHALNQALQKLQSELMLLGFISLLLTVFQGLISRMCIPEHLTNYMLPCKKPDSVDAGTVTEQSFQGTWNRRHLLSEGESESHCAKGKVPLLSIEALHQLHIFIFVLAVVYVVFCATTMVLGRMKVHKWRHWEDSIRREVSNVHGNQRFTEIHARHSRIFQQRASGYCSCVLSFFKQFYRSVSKSDYIILRHGFIMAHCPANTRFNFHKYMMRTLEFDFKKVVGVSWFLWAFLVLFLLINLRGWHSFFWMSFLPLILLLIVGAKLEHIITCMAEEFDERSSASNEGEQKPEDRQRASTVKPSDEHFWFGRPSIVLYLIHFILFQNSFEIAFLFWVLSTYGIHSCILDKLSFMIPRLVIGILIQVLCSYSTLPLYAIVTQMGSEFNKNILDEFVGEYVHLWATEHSGHGTARHLQAQNTDPETLEVDPHQDTTVAIDTPSLT